MKTVAALLVLVAAANAGLLHAPTVISRAPAFDSAVIKSDRLGGNFAYSVAESHAYAAHTPIVQQVASPVAVSYSAAPVAYSAGHVAYSAGLPLGYSGLGYTGLGYAGLGYGYGLAGQNVVRVAKIGLLNCL